MTCTCGSKAVGANIHSEWCDFNKTYTNSKLKGYSAFRRFKSNASYIGSYYNKKTLYLTDDKEKLNDTVTQINANVEIGKPEDYIDKLRTEKYDHIIIESESYRSGEAYSAAQNNQPKSSHVEYAFPDEDFDNDIAYF